ncbi:hypothetical protein A374_05671 [Fictibacillus macauensis ZFHKF-1]|uniref:TrmB family transcriptional regulator n=1 Tax=Fictibacillus macauensis ZFHKF-1 TaxID=1196324 RepID=I8J3T2_9BACL|nr:TrmB family transcriptional regulator [Fictibacillus macauensis]EIT86426.1 hypothetical protein A374_05671 [Fictibacillus macauensis ZFHKF-1]
MLQQFGFTQYESQVYQALLTSSEPLDATNVVKRSAVPRSKVYEVLHRLLEKGMILETTVEKKRLYVPLPLDEAIEKLKADFEENVKQLKAAQQKKVIADDRVWTLKDNHSIQAFMQTMLHKADTSIVFSGWYDDIEHFLPLLEAKEQDGVDVSIHVIGHITTSLKHVSTLIPEPHHGALERSRLLVVDEQEMLFAGIEDTKWQAITTEARPLVMFLTEFFYHDVALTEITRKYKDIVMKDEAVKALLLKLRY